MSGLSLFYENSKVGDILSEDEQLSFQYHTNWLNNKNAFPLSQMIPLDQSIQREAAHNFFVQLLPEKNIIERIALREKYDPTDLMETLKHVGKDCAGAFVIAESLPSKTSCPKPQKLKKEILEQFMEYDFVESQEDYYAKKLSLAGAQDKMPVIQKDDGLYSSTELEPSTHILKFPILAGRLFRNLSVNELYCTIVAGLAGVHSISMQAVKMGDDPLILSKRYDRSKQGSEVKRLHQEDMCQATGKEQKYEVYSDGVTLRDVLGVLNKCSLPALERDRLFNWLVFNSIIRNGDNHAKNISILYKGGGVELAPFYDLISTGIYGRRWDTNMAFAIGDVREPDKMTLKKWELSQPLFDYSKSEVHQKVRDLGAKVIAVIDAFDHPLSEHPTVQDINKLIKKQLKGMLR